MNEKLEIKTSQVGWTTLTLGIRLREASLLSGDSTVVVLLMCRSRFKKRISKLSVQDPVHTSIQRKGFV